MNNQNKKNRGLAILTTLLILSLLLALIAAFLTVNRAGNLFTVNSLDRRQAQDICMTAFSYAWFELERERSWGDATPVSGSEQYPVVSPQVRMDLVQTDAKLVTVTGVYSPSGNFAEPTGEFTMTIENNLQQRGTHLGATGPVPGRSARVSVVATIGTVRQQLNSVLRQKPSTHSSVSSGRNINLDDTAGIVRIESKDPYVNQISTAGDLNLPPAEDVQFLKHGTALSHGELNVGGLNLAGATNEQIMDAGEASGGKYITTDVAPNPIEEFDPSEISLPNLTTDIAAGTWVFGDVTHQQYIPHNLTYQEYAPSPGGPVPAGHGHTMRYQKKESLYNQLTAPDGRIWVAETAVAGSEVLDPPYDPAPFYGSEGAAEAYGYGGTGDEGYFDPDTGTTLTPTGTGSDVHQIAPGFKANVVTAQMVVLPEYSIRSGGDFIVESEGSRLPELYFGYDLTAGGVAEQTSLNDGIEAAQNEPSKYMAAVIAGNDVDVTGGVLGYGSMLAGGDLTIKASSGLRAAPDLGVVVKGNRIIINPATEAEPTFPGQPVDADYPLFRNAIQANTGGDWSQFDIWLDHDKPTRDALVDSLKDQSTGSNATTLWNQLTSEMGVPFPPPDFASYGWTDPATVDQYARMKEFLQTQASGYNDGDGDPSWLNLSIRQEDASGRVKNVLNTIAQWARSYKLTFQQFLADPEQSPPEMFLAGLIYADEDLIINADGKTVRLEGAVIARDGDLTINAPSQVDLVYNRALLDDLAATDTTGQTSLERVFFTLE